MSVFNKMYEGVLLVFKNSLRFYLHVATVPYRLRIRLYSKYKYSVPDKLDNYFFGMGVNRLLVQLGIKGRCIDSIFFFFIDDRTNVNHGYDRTGGISQIARNLRN